MNQSAGLANAIIAGTVALLIAVASGWLIHWRWQKDRDDRRKEEQAKQLARLLQLHMTPSMGPEHFANVAEMKAILLTLPGHFATLLRTGLDLRHTMRGVPVDPVTARRLKPDERDEAGHKWLLFQRSSADPGKTLNRKQPADEWVEAELAYDIAGLLNGDQQAVLDALSKDMRDEQATALNDLRAAMRGNAKQP
jgi:hypothetical protein